MQVALSDLNVNVGKYIDKEPWYLKQIPEQITSIEQLFGTLPNDIDLDDIRTERLSK